MSTQSPTAVEQSAAILHRIKKIIVKVLDLYDQLPSMQKSQYDHHCSMVKMATELEYIVKKLIRKMEDNQKGYENQLQKCEEKLRKNAKMNCEKKLYCQYLQEELKTTKTENTQFKKEITYLTTNYNKQIDTLKTELSNAIISRKNNKEQTKEKISEEKKPLDVLGKIKLKILNMGAVQIEQPQSCANTYRKSLNYNLEDIKPNSEPTSLLGTPKKIQKKKLKRKSQGKNRSKSSSSLRNEGGKEIKKKRIVMKN